MTEQDQDRCHFMLRCPQAAHVFLIGDFNNWSTTATPMQRGDDDSLWELNLPVVSNPCRFGYFVIDKDFANGGNGRVGRTFVVPA